MTAGARLQALLFHGLCVTGLVVAAVLAVAGAGDEPDLMTRVLSQEREGEATRVVAQVRNTTDQPLCVRLRVAARDREARDLASVPVDPAELEVPAGGAARAVATVTLSPQEYAEELDEISAYVQSRRRC